MCQSCVVGLGNNHLVREPELVAVVEVVPDPVVEEVGVLRKDFVPDPELVPEPVFVADPVAEAV